MWIVEYLETGGGDCPVSQFLDRLNKKTELPYAIRKIDLLKQFGNKLERPHAAPLRDGIYELRIPIKHIQYRLLYFFFYQDKIIITHGTRKWDIVPEIEIRKAIKYKDDFFKRNERMK
jgi:phage-related protein